MTVLRKFMGYTGYGLMSVFFILVIIFGAFTKGTVSFTTPWQVLFFSMIGFAILFWLIRYVLDKCTFIHKDWIFSVFVGVITVGVRIPWVYLVKTVPEIDFLRFHEYTKALISGNYEAYLKIRTVFPHISGFPLFQSFYYRIFGDSVWSGISFNIICTALTSVVMYYLIREIRDRSSGRIGAVLFALWPNQIMFSSLIASEPLFTLLFMLSFLIFYKAIRPMKNVKLIGYGLGLGLVLALSQAVRPISSTFIPTLICFLFLYNKDFEGTKTYFFRGTTLIIAVVIAFYTSLAAINFAFSDETLVPLGAVKSGMSLFAGTSIESDGMWNPEVTKILEKNNYAYEASHSEGMKRGIENITSNPKAFMKLVVKKFPIQWAIDDFGLYWSTVNTQPETDFTLWIKASWDNREVLYVIAQSYYLAVLLLGLIYALYLLVKRNLGCSEGTAIIMVLGFTLLHCLTEVQPRYHYSLMPFFIIMAVAGLNILKRSKYDENTI